MIGGIVAVVVCTIRCNFLSVGTGTKYMFSRLVVLFCVATLLTNCTTVLTFPCSPFVWLHFIIGLCKVESTLWIQVFTRFYLDWRWLLCDRTLIEDGSFCFVLLLLFLCPVPFWDGSWLLLKHESRPCSPLSLWSVQIKLKMVRAYCNFMWITTFTGLHITSPSQPYSPSPSPNLQ